MIDLVAVRLEFLPEDWNYPAFWEGVIVNG